MPAEGSIVLPMPLARRVLRSPAVPALRPSARRVLAWAGTLLLHLAMIQALWQGTRVEPPAPRPAPIEVLLYDFVTPSPPMPPSAEASEEKRASTRRPVSAPRDVAPAETIEVVDQRPPIEAAIDWQALRERAVREQLGQPRRAPFAGKDLGSQLPGADNRRLPGFRPPSRDDLLTRARNLAQALAQPVPRAAAEHDAMTDLLTEDWEARHHASDLQACERQYPQFEPAMRRRLCGG